MCSGRGDGPLRPPGFPIRKSPDLSLVADSPGLIAGSNVLLRLLVPRHPPCALINLATTDDARVHYAVLKIRAVPGLHRQLAGEVRVRSRSSHTAVPSGPNSVLGSRGPRDLTFHATCAQRASAAVLASPGELPEPNNQCSTNELPPRDTRSGCGSGPRRTALRQTPPGQALLRKEVIQPHLPVRLPCYDFVPIAGPTFDGSLPKGLGHRLRVLPTFVT